MTSTTWASPRYVQELATILGPQNRTQGSCELAMLYLYVHIAAIVRTVPVPTSAIPSVSYFCPLQTFYPHRLG